MAGDKRSNNKTRRTSTDSKRSRSNTKTLPSTQPSDDVDEDLIDAGLHSRPHSADGVSRVGSKRKRDAADSARGVTTTEAAVFFQSLLKTLEDRPDCHHFLAPVFEMWEDSAIPGYREKIDTPMDLRTVRERLEDGFYALPFDSSTHHHHRSSAATPEKKLFVFDEGAAAHDIRLIFLNAMDYNVEKSAMHTTSKRVLAFVDDSLRLRQQKVARNAERAKRDAERRRRKIAEEEAAAATAAAARTVAELKAAKREAEEAERRRVADLKRRDLEWTAVVERAKQQAVQAALQEAAANTEATAAAVAAAAAAAASGNAAAPAVLPSIVSQSDAAVPSRREKKSSKKSLHANGLDPLIATTQTALQRQHHAQSLQQQQVQQQLQKQQLQQQQQQKQLQLQLQLQQRQQQQLLLQQQRQQRQQQQQKQRLQHQQHQHQQHGLVNRRIQVPGMPAQATTSIPNATSNSVSSDESDTAVPEITFAFVSTAGMEKKRGRKSAQVMELEIKHDAYMRRRKVLLDLTLELEREKKVLMTMGEKVVLCDRVAKLDFIRMKGVVDIIASGMNQPSLLSEIEVEIDISTISNVVLREIQFFLNSPTAMTIKDELRSIEAKIATIEAQLVEIRYQKAAS